MKSAAERQRASIERRKAEGEVRTTLWIKPDTLEALKARFAGPRGGVNWEALFLAALAPAPASESAPSEYNLDVERLRRKIRQLEAENQKLKSAPGRVMP